MKSLRRFDFNNRDYFITTVTYNRIPILLKDINLFWKSWKYIKPKAWVMLPGHFHIIINSGDIGLSKLIHSFKRTYTWNYKLMYENGRVWQNRFWDH